MANLDVTNAIQNGIRPNFLIGLLMGLIVLALINTLLPANYKLSRVLSGLFA
jgi:tetrahydromethanopterin S-methyltransferase subunit B